MSEITQGRGQGEGDHPVTAKMADGSPEPVSELLTVDHLSSGKMYFLVVFVFYFLHSLFFIEKDTVEKL